MCANSCGTHRGNGSKATGSKRTLEKPTSSRDLPDQTHANQGAGTSESDGKSGPNGDLDGESPAQNSNETVPSAWICNYCLRRDQVDDVINAQLEHCPSCHKMCKHLNDTWEQNASATPTTWPDALTEHFVTGKCLIERFGGWEASPDDPEDIHEHTVCFPNHGGFLETPAKRAKVIHGPIKSGPDVGNASDSNAIDGKEQVTPAWLISGCESEDLHVEIQDELFKNLGARAYSRTLQIKNRDYAEDLKQLHYAVEHKTLRAHYKLCQVQWTSLAN